MNKNIGYSNFSSVSFRVKIIKNTKITHIWAFVVVLKLPLLYVQNVVDKDFLKALGNRVRELRLARKLTQEELGYAVGNSGKQIGRIERGENNVSTCMIYQISKALEVSLSELFDFRVD